jgi:hypothetical protein
MAEIQELELLRARIKELEQHRDESPPRRALRSSTSGVLIVLACVLAPLSAVTVWASTVMSDTDRYVETVAPLADEPQVQQALSDEVTTVIVEGLDVERLSAEALAALAAQRDRMPPRAAELLPALAMPLTEGIEGFVHERAGQVLAGPGFSTVWEKVNRASHAQVVAMLEGEDGAVLSAGDGSVTVELGPVVELVKQRLVDAGFALAAQVPAVDRSFVLVSSDAIDHAMGGYSLLTGPGRWLPVVVVALLVAGIAVARDRRRALVRGAAGVAGALVALLVALAVTRWWYVGTTPADLLTQEGAGNVYDALVRFLRSGVLTAAVVALLVALAAVLAGPTRTRLHALAGRLAERVARLLSDRNSSSMGDATAASTPVELETRGV